MIDHVFDNLIRAMQQRLESAMLESLPNQEHLLLDLFLGDIRYENSYALPGEVNPSNMRVDINLEWPIWSQSICGSWMIGASEPESLKVGIKTLILAVNMIEPAPTTSVLAALDERSSQTLGFIQEGSSAINSESALGEEIAPEFEFELEFGFDRNKPASSRIHPGVKGSRGKATRTVTPRN